MYQLTKPHEELILDALYIASPAEACGIVTANGIFELENAAPNCGSFRITGEELSAYVSHLRELDAVWHTHPSGDPLPSEDDLAGHPWPAALVIGTREGVVVYATREIAERYV